MICYSYEVNLLMSATTKMAGAYESSARRPATVVVVKKNTSLRSVLIELAFPRAHTAEGQQQRGDAPCIGVRGLCGRRTQRQRSRLLAAYGGSP